MGGQANTNSTFGSSNFAGSTQSTVSVNSTANFSIVKYVGADAVRTVGHGLGIKPNIIIVKRLGSTANWEVYHSSLGATKQLHLNANSAAGTSSARWNDTEPTSSVFTLSTSANVNESGDYIAFCFADKTGYSKFNSYTGNGSTDGPFIYTGFKPAFFIHKRTSGAGGWYIYDNKRGPFNEIKNTLKAEEAVAEDANADYNDVDFLSNGVKITEDNNDINASGDTYVYIAFGQSLVGSNNVPATAR